MKKNISERKQEFIMQIRRQHKKQIFREARQKLQISQKQNLHYMDELKNKSKIQQSMQIIRERINTRNAFTQIMKIMDQGIVQILISNLQNQKHLMQCFKLISAILSKNEVKVARNFVNRGIFEYLLKYLKCIQFTEICFNIFRNIAVQEQDYCEIILQNKLHLVFMAQIQTIIQSEKNMDVENRTIDNGLSLLSVVSSVQSNLNFSGQFNDILQFIASLMERKIYLSSCLQISYELSNKNIDEVRNFIEGKLAKFIQEGISNETAMKNLLHLIWKLSPLNIDYRNIFKIAVMEPKYFSFSLKILEKVMNIEIFASQFVRDQIWWQKAIQIAQNDNDQAILLKIILIINIKGQFVWRLLEDFMDGTQSKKYQIEALLFIHTQLNQQNQSDYLVNMFQKHGIIKQLKILCDERNFTISQKAGQLMQIIYSQPNNQMIY